MFSLVSEVVSILTIPQLLQMRGGADTDEKMGHEQDMSPNPRAMCYHFHLGAQCQVCRHQLLRVWCCGWRGGERKFKGGNKMK